MNDGERRMANDGYAETVDADARSTPPSHPPSAIRHPSLTILHIITRMILGGAQQNTVMSCAAQVRAGHRVVLAFGPIYGPEGSLLDEARESGAELVEVKSMRRAVLPGRDLLTYRELRRLIRRVRPDVVHTHSSKAGIVGRAAAWAQRVPAVIHTVHGLPFHDRQNPLIRRLYVALERWAAKRCHRLIAITPAMTDAFADRGIAPRGKFTVIPSGIDMGRFDPAVIDPARARRLLGLNPGAPVVGIVARFDPLKGHDDLLDILPRLVEPFPDLAVVFIGDGWRREHLQARVRTGGYESRVALTGLISHGQVVEALPALDVMALPSYQEGQSRTLIESLLCGCGIVAYGAGGIPTICIDGETGRLVPVGDKAALADAIVWMLRHPDQRRAMVERGRAHVRDRFDARRMVEMIEAVYHDVLNT